MILSTSHQFIFVHVPKTAGWSIMDTLQPYNRPHSRTLFRSLTRKLPVVESVESAHFRVHETASKMIAKLTYSVWSRYYSFAVIRNPFDHAVSHYEYLKQHRSKSIAKFYQRITFESYLVERQKKPFLNNTIFVRMPDQAYFILDDANQIAVNKLLRFENLATEWEQLVETLGLKDLKLLHVNKTISKAKGKLFSSYYNHHTEEIVRNIYKRDFDLFGYSNQLLEN